MNREYGSGVLSCWVCDHAVRDSTSNQETDTEHYVTYTKIITLTLRKKYPALKTTEARCAGLTQAGKRKEHKSQKACGFVRKDAEPGKNAARSQRDHVTPGPALSGAQLPLLPQNNQEHSTELRPGRRLVVQNKVRKAPAAEREMPETHGDNKLRSPTAKPSLHTEHCP